MHDLKLLRERPGELREAMRRRGALDALGPQLDRCEALEQERRLLVQAVQNQDYTLTQALVMLTVAVFVFTNLIVDLLYGWLDPRIRFS